MNRFPIFISFATIIVLLSSTTLEAYAQTAAELFPKKPLVTVQKAPAFTPSEASIGVPNEIIGAVTIRVKGGTAAISRMLFKITVDNDPSFSVSIANVSLFDEGGTIVEGPTDAAGDGTITFSDILAVQAGIHVYTVRALLRSSGISHGQVIRLITKPSADWIILDATTGKKVTTLPPVVALTPVTAGTGKISVYRSLTAVTPTAYPGALGHVFAYVILDAAESFDDLHVSRMEYTFETSEQNPAGIENCGLYDQKTPVTSILYPSASGKQVFTFTPTFALSEKTKKELALSCDITSGASGSYRWSVSGTDVLNAYSIQSGISAISTVVPFVGTAVEVIR